MSCKLRGFEEVDPWEFNPEVFKNIGKDYFEIVVGNECDKTANAMTAAWGGMGVMWNYPVMFTVVRGKDYRASRPILDEQPLFSVCFLDDDQNEAKIQLGRTHGWDDPHKIETAGLHTGWFGTELEHNAKAGIGRHVHTPFIEESKAVLICEKIAVQELELANFLDPEILEKHYTKEDGHCLYISRIHSVFVKRA